MRSVLLSIASLLFACPLWATWGVVQQSQSTYNSAASMTTQFPAAVTAGDLLLVQVNWSDTTNTVSSVADTNGNTFISVGSPARQSGTSTQLFYAANTNGGLDRITATMSGSTHIILFAYEIAGADVSNPLDVTATGNGSSSTVTTGSITTTGTNEFIFMGAGIGRTDWTSPGPGFIGLQENVYGFSQYQTIASAGFSLSGTATLSASGSWTAVIAAFHSNPVSSSGGGSATLTSIQITPFSPTLSMGQTVQLAAFGTFSDGSTQNLTSAVVWGASSPTIATISTSGLATATGHGTTTVTATDGSVSGSTPLIVEGSLSSIQVTPATDSLTVGATQQFTATGNFNDGTSENITSSVGWTSSNTSVATTNSSGMVTAVAAGGATITASSGALAGSATLTALLPASGGTAPAVQTPLVQANFQWATSYYMQSPPPSSAGTSCSPAPCIAQTFLNPNTTGNLIFVWVSWSSGGFSLVNLSDSAGNVYTHVPGFPITYSNGVVDDFWVAQNTLGSASNRVTALFGSGTVKATRLQIMEFSGLATSNALDVYSNASKTPTCSAPCTLASAASPATTQASELLVSLFELLNCGSTCPTVEFTVGSGWTPVVVCDACFGWGGQDAGGAVLTEMQPVSSSGSYTATSLENTTNNPNYVSYVFAFKLTTGP